MKPIKLDAGFEKEIRLAALCSNSFSKDEKSNAVVSKVCARARRMSDNNELTGETIEQLQGQIYGSFLVWVFLWRYRSIIMLVIKLIARLALSQREEESGTVVITSRDLT